MMMGPELIDSVDAGGMTHVTSDRNGFNSGGSFCGIILGKTTSLNKEKWIILGDARFR